MPNRGRLALPGNAASDCLTKGTRIPASPGRIGTGARGSVTRWRTPMPRMDELPGIFWQAMSTAGRKLVAGRAADEQGDGKFIR